MGKDDAGAELLRTAWDEMIADLERARDAIDDPALMPPPQSPRNLAEGYRYLMGFVHGAVERAMHADPARPAFRNALSIINRATIDNADAIYFYAVIDGRSSYRVRGHAPKGSAPPHYLIFEASCGVLAGDTGDLRELTPGVKTQTGRLDSTHLQLEPDGSFELILAPERPAGHAGNFVSSYRRASQPNPLDPQAGPDRFADFLSGRQLFGDWEREEAYHLSIERLDEDRHPLVSYGPEQAASELRAAGRMVRGQMHFWNAFWTIPMGTYGHRPGGIEGVEFPRNAFNEVNAASGATGGGMSTNLYAGGVFELAEGDALVVEMRVPRPPQYMGVQLANLWGESLEYGSAMGSLNSAQLGIDPDGVVRIVVADCDPGVQNWLDTQGHAEGFMAPRWAYTEKPVREDWPSVEARLVRFDELGDHLHPETARVTREQRSASLRARRAHVARRFRVF